MIRQKPTTVQFTSKSLLALLAIVAMVGSAVYWWGVQSQLTENRVVAIAYTAILVLAPPSLVSFLIPWSPAGMLLQKVNLRTIGSTVVIVCALYLIYYSYQIQWSWWSAQPVVRDTNLVDQQMLIGIIGFIIIPALLWTPVSSDELVEQVRQAHLVKRYELQTQADIAILRATLLRAQQLALRGFANLTIQERQELSGVLNGLMSSIDRTLQEVGDSVKSVSGVALPFDGLLDDNEDIRGVLDYISNSLADTQFTDQEPEVLDQALMQLEAQPRPSVRRNARAYEPEPRERAPLIASTRREVEEPEPDYQPRTQTQARTQPVQQSTQPARPDARKSYARQRADAIAETVRTKGYAFNQLSALEIELLRGMGLTVHMKNQVNGKWACEVTK